MINVTNTNNATNSDNNNSSFLTPTGDVNVKKDMFETDEFKLEHLTKIQNYVNGTVKALGVLKKIVDINAVEYGKPDSLEDARKATSKTFLFVKSQIEKFDDINTNLMIMPNGLSCKKIDVKPILNSQVERFENLLESIIKFPVNQDLTSEMCSNYVCKTSEELDIDFKILSLKIDIANRDFKNIETQTLHVLSRLSPTKRKSDLEKKKDTSTVLYKEILNQYSKIALVKDQFATHLLLLAAKVDLLRSGKNIVEKLSHELNTLAEFNSNPEIVEVKGTFLSWTYVKLEKESEFKEKVKEVNENFDIYSSDARTYKERVHVFLDTPITLIDEQYSKDLAYGVQEQLNINSKFLSESNKRTASVRAELQKDINDIWTKITVVQEQLLRKLQQSIQTIDKTKKSDDSNEQMCLVSERLAAWNGSSSALLNPNLHAAEEKKSPKQTEEKQSLVEEKDSV